MSDPHRSAALARRILLLAIFFASGASGLVYELVWIRQFGTLFGSSVHSVALVTAIFMCGIGLGAWLAAGLADHSFRADPVAPLRWYGRFELAIAALAVLVLLLMPQLARISAGAASYHADEHGWLRLVASGSVVRYGCAAVLLLPVTLLMGGTLTLLVRFLIASDLARAGRYVGLLYGVNTAGAAFGCLATDTVFVPLLGLRGTQGVALCGNLFAAAGAGWLVRAARRDAMAMPVSAAKPAARDARVAWLALALAGTGFASMAMQIVWFRQLIAVYGAYRPVFSILLTVILVGIWLGSWTAGRATEKAPAPVLFALSLAGFTVFALIGIALPGHDASGSGAMPMRPDTEAFPWLRLYGRLLRDISWAVGPAAFFAGAAFPLANAIAQRRPDFIGRRVGVLYLAATLGGVVGSLAAGFLLLPRLGVQSTAAAVMLSVLAAWFALGRAVDWRAGHASWLAQGASGLAILAALFAWSRLPGEYLIRRSLPLAADATGEGVLAVHEGVNETLAIVSTPRPSLDLLTNGFSMSGTAWGPQRYMRAFVHVPMLLDPEIERVMVMCFGVGNTVSAALAHPQVRKIDIVDLSADVLAHSAYFEAANGRPLDDPRVAVHVNDARHHLLMESGETYDLITGEPPPITQVGTVNLYTEEFFALLRSRLRPGGFVTYWLPLWDVGGVGARQIARAFLDVFPGAVLLSGYGPELILVGRKGGEIAIDPERVARRLQEVPGVREDLRGIELATASDLVGMLAATAPTLERATRDVAPLRDDRPMLEYAIREVAADWRIPGDFFSVADVDRWCPRCFAGALDPEGEVELRGYLEVMELYYRSELFLARRPRSPREGAAPLSAAARSALAGHLYLQDLLSELPPEQRRVLNLVRHGRSRGAIETLKDLLRVDPANERARTDLADLRVQVSRSMN